MSVFDDRRADRALMEEFCKTSGFVGDFDFRSYDWDEDIVPKLSEFLKSKNSDKTPEFYKYKSPLRFIIKAFADESAWNEYWRISDNKEDSAKTSDYIRNQFCNGIGSRKIKKLLNDCGTLDCKIMRLIFEVEDIVISSAKYYGEFLKRNIERRDDAIYKLYEYSKDFPEKLSVHNINGSMIVCNANVSGFNTQFCWSILDGECKNIPETNCEEVSIKIYKTQKIFRIEEIIGKLLHNGKQM